jgi:hypothetical protein
VRIELERRARSVAREAHDAWLCARGVRDVDRAAGDDQALHAATELREELRRASCRSGAQIDERVAAGFPRAAPVLPAAVGADRFGYGRVLADVEEHAARRDQRSDREHEREGARRRQPHG